MKSLGNFPDPFIAEISGQPDALRRAARGLGSQAAGLDWLAREAAGRTVVFTGMGSSYDACYPALNELAAGGIAALMIDSAELLHFRQAMLGERAFVVAVSQSGESAEIMRLAYELRQRAERPLVAVITNGLRNSLARMADVAFDTFVGTETGPSTMTFAASLVLLSAISRILSGASGIDAADMTVAQVEDAASSIERLLVDGSLPERLSAWLGDRRTLVILGRGPARAARPS